VTKKTKVLIFLALLAFLDALIPIPITAMALIMVVFQKPKRLKNWIDEIYSQ
jgi:hypothetical protein